MATKAPTSEMLVQEIWIDGLRWFSAGGMLFAPMGGGEDDPKPADPPKADDPKDEDFDKDRALATIRKLREGEKEAKATKKQLDDALERLKAIEDKDKTDAEKLAGTAKEASEKLTAAEARAQDLVIRLSVERTARKLNFIDEDDAYRLIDRKAVEMDDDGEPTNVEALLKKLAESKPHLVKSADGDDPKKPAAQKSPPPTPKPNGKPASRDELVNDKYERLKASGGYSRM